MGDSITCVYTVAKVGGFWGRKSQSMTVPSIALFC